ERRVQPRRRSLRIADTATSIPNHEPPAGPNRTRHYRAGAGAAKRGHRTTRSAKFETRNSKFEITQGRFRQHRAEGDAQRTAAPLRISRATLGRHPPASY